MKSKKAMTMQEFLKIALWIIVALLLLIAVGLLIGKILN